MVLVLVTSPTCWWKKPNLLDAKLTLAMRTPMEANGKASFEICESVKFLESLLRTCVSFHSDAIWCYGELNDTGIQSLPGNLVWWSYITSKIASNFDPLAFSVGSWMPGVAVKNLPNCFTRNSFADYGFEESFVATLSPTFMIQWEMRFSDLASPDWWIYTSKKSNQAKFLMNRA